MTDAPHNRCAFELLCLGNHIMDERWVQDLRLAFRLEGLPVGAIEIRPHHLGLLEVEIEGRGPFILASTLLEDSDPEGGYVSQGLRDWIDQVYLKIRCGGST